MRTNQAMLFAFRREFLYPQAKWWPLGKRRQAHTDSIQQVPEFLPQRDGVVAVCIELGQ